MDAAKDDDAQDQTGSSDRWALAARLPPEPRQPTPTFVTVRELDPAEFAEVEAANAMLRRFSNGSPYQRLHQAVRLLGQHAERARTSAARVPQPPLQRETARMDRAIDATLTAAEKLLSSLVNDIVADHGEQSPQAVTISEAVDQARHSSLVVAMSRPLLALAATQPRLS